MRPEEEASLGAPSAPGVDAEPAAALSSVRFAAVLPGLTPRQRQVLAVFRATQSVRGTAILLGLSESRAYAIFAQVARKLDVAPGALREALRCGELSPLPVSERGSTTRMARDPPPGSGAAPVSTGTSAGSSEKVPRKRTAASCTAMPRRL